MLLVKNEAESTDGPAAINNNMQIASKESHATMGAKYFNQWVSKASTIRSSELNVRSLFLCHGNEENEAITKRVEQK